MSKVWQLEKVASLLPYIPLCWNCYRKDCRQCHSLNCGQLSLSLLPPPSPDFVSLLGESTRLTLAPGCSLGDGPYIVKGLINASTEHSAGVSYLTKDHVAIIAMDTQLNYFSSIPSFASSCDFGNAEVLEVWRGALVGNSAGMKTCTWNSK